MENENFKCIESRELNPLERPKYINKIHNLYLPRRSFHYKNANEVFTAHNDYLLFIQLYERLDVQKNIKECQNG